MNKDRAKQLRSQVVKFVDLMSGTDNRYVAPEQNLIALNGMALGWLMAQSWYPSYEESVVRKYPRENVPLTLSEGTIADIIREETHGNPDFDSAVKPLRVKA